MLELRLVHGRLLTKVVEAVKEVATDVNFDCSTKGLSLQALHSNGTALVALLLRSEGFEHYHCDSNISLGLNLNTMATMLTCVGSNGVVNLKADDGSDVVKFMVESPSQDKIADFEMKLVEIDYELLETPETRFDATVRMPSAEFARICRDLSSIGSTVVITVTEEGVEFSTRGDNIGDADVIVQPEDATVMELNEPVTLSFALSYLNSFTKATPLSNTVTLSLSSNLPVGLEYNIADMGNITFYLAPEIEEDDEEDAEP